MYLADYHVHSSCSPDGHVTMADMAAEGIRRGLNEICFTDHVDYGIKRDWDDPRGIAWRDGGHGPPLQVICGIRRLRRRPSWRRR